MDKIFVQIASYRDIQLLTTIRDCITNAKYPERLTFGICWQKDDTESLEEYIGDSRFKIIQMPYAESKGCCWARSKTQSLYNGEKYTLQIDAHTRFTPHWDEICISMMKDLIDKGHKKPLLTGYPPSFEPDKPKEEWMQTPLQMSLDKFVDHGVVNLKSYRMFNFEHLTSPKPAMFISAGFIFTFGLFCKEIPYDPNIQFRGEEITMATRAYTHGYDFFHPHKIIVWHLYGRFDQPRPFINENTQKAYQRCNTFMGVNGLDRNSVDFNPYDIGKERSFKDYEEYIGICFSTQNIDEHLKKSLI